MLAALEFGLEFEVGELRVGQVIPRIGDGEAALEAEIIAREPDEIGVDALADDFGDRIDDEHQAVEGVELKALVLLIEQRGVEEQLAIEQRRLLADFIGVVGLVWEIGVADWGQRGGAAGCATGLADRALDAIEVEAARLVAARIGRIDQEIAVE